MKKPNNQTALFQNIKSLIEDAQKNIVRNINTTILFNHFQIGKMIVKDEQKESAGRICKRNAEKLEQRFIRSS